MYVCTYVFADSTFANTYLFEFLHVDDTLYVGEILPNRSILYSVKGCTYLFLSSVFNTQRNETLKWCGKVTMRGHSAVMACYLTLPSASESGEEENPLWVGWQHSDQAYPYTCQRNVTYVLFTTWHVCKAIYAAVCFCTWNLFNLHLSYWEWKCAPN